MENETPDVASDNGSEPLYKEILSEGYGIAPNVVTFDERLSSSAKLLFFYLTSMAAATGVCYPKNKHLADRFKVVPRQISRWLTELEEVEYIELLYADPETKTGKREIIISSLGRTKMSRGVDKNVYSDRHSSTEITETINNTSKENSNKELDDQIRRLHNAYIIYVKLDPTQYFSLPIEEQAHLRTKARNQYKLTPPRRAKIVSRLKDCGYDMCLAAIKRIGESDWHRDNHDGKWYAKLEWIFNSYEKVEEWANKESEA